MDPRASSRAAHRYQPRHPHNTHRHDRKNNTGHPSNGPGPKRRLHEQGHGDTLGGKSKRVARLHTGDNLVQIWLEKTGTISHDPGMGSRIDTKVLTAQHNRSHQNRGKAAPDHLLESHAARQLQEFVRGDRAHSLLPVLSRNNYRQHKVHGWKRSTSADSSFLSVVDDHGPHFADPASSPRRAYADDETLSGEWRRKVDARNQETLSERSATPGSAYFERRPRRKTRDDTYDRKEKRTPVDPEEVLRRHKSQKDRKDGKRRALTSSQNVMSNFNSKAVLNDRITVSRKFKPGIFQNGREAGTRPIPDLSFSNMRFLQDRKHDTKPKPISKKRLRELERQNKEIEAVSSFFLPPRLDGNVKPSKSDEQNKRDCFEELQSQGIRVPTRASAQTVSMSSASSPGPIAESHKSLQWSENTSQIRPSGPREIPSTRHDSNRVSKETTYFTWSSNHTRSPSRPKRKATVGSPRLSPRPDSCWSITPESTRRALIATGLYRGTGIYPYDDTTFFSRHERETSASAIDIRSDRPPGHGDSHGKSSGLNQNPDYRDLSAMEDDLEGSVLDRPRKILPSNWRIDRGESRPETAIEGGTQSGSVLPDKIRSNDHIQGQSFAPKESTSNRQKIAEDARLSIQGKKGAPILSPTGGTSRNEIDSHDCQRKQGLEASPHLQQCSTGDTVSINSRDAMPPPPLPQKIFSPRPVRTTTDSKETLGGYRHHPSSEEIPACQPLTSQFGTEQRYATDISIMGHNSLMDSQNTTASTFSSLQSASWIPQAETLPTIALLRSTNRSRNSARHPIYAVNQSIKVPERINDKTSQAANAQNCESMACFIARIEREVEEPPRQLPREDTSQGGEQTNAGVTFEGHYGDQLDGRLNDQNTSTLNVPNLQGEQYTRPGLHDGDLNYHQETDKSINMEDAYQWNDTYVPRALYQSEQDEAEKLEMAAFWRPNQFTQF